MTNGEYIVYAYRHGANNGFVDHLFLGHGSDGRWLYSTYHFCNSKVRYEEPLSREDRQQDMYYLVAEALAGLLSGKKAEMYRKRLEKGLTWDEQAKTWKWKE